jgi:hypothetical protein
MIRLFLISVDNINETTVSLEAYGGRCSDQYIPETYKEKDVYELLEEAIKANPHSAYLIAKELKIKISPEMMGQNYYRCIKGIRPSSTKI